MVAPLPTLRLNISILQFVVDDDGDDDDDGGMLHSAYNNPAKTVWVSFVDFTAHIVH